MPPVVPFSTPFLGEASPTKLDYSKKGTHILSSLLEVVKEREREVAKKKSVATKLYLVE